MVSKDLLESVTSRANVLARRYYFLEKEDLMQNGYIFLMDLNKKQFTDKQKHKAINNMFANLERHARYRQKIEKNSSSLSYEADFVDELYDPEEELSKRQITGELIKKLTRPELVILDWLANGWSFDQIAKILRINHDTVRRQVMSIISKREEIEDDKG